MWLVSHPLHRPYLLEYVLAHIFDVGSPLKAISSWDKPHLDDMNSVLSCVLAASIPVCGSNLTEYLCWILWLIIRLQNITWVSVWSTDHSGRMIWYFDWWTCLVSLGPNHIRWYQQTRTEGSAGQASAARFNSIFGIVSEIFILYGRR